MGACLHKYSIRVHMAALLEYNTDYPIRVY